jgi:hypothetical protein
MTICDLCYEHGDVNDAPETCVECSADMCPKHGEGEFCTRCLAQGVHLEHLALVPA